MVGVSRQDKIKNVEVEKVQNKTRVVTNNKFTLKIVEHILLDYLILSENTNFKIGGKKY